MVKFRLQRKLWLLDQTQRYADDNFYAFTRGKFFMAFTNTDNNLTRNITYHPYANNETLCNIYDQNDCFTVQNGNFNINMNGHFKIYVPK